jgi:dUTP pyrophosphatase
MIISPKTAIAEGWVTGLYDEDEQVQPNGLDFTLDKVFEPDNNSEFLLTTSTKEHRKMSQLDPVGEYPALWTLTQGHYDGMSDMYVTVPQGVMVLTIIRSTLNRNGIFLTSGIYDSSFQGNIGFMLHVQCPVAKIEPGSRVGQLMFFEADSATEYLGGYNTDQGKHWTESA